MIVFSGLENPAPWLACLVSITTLALIGGSLIVGVTAFLITWLDATTPREYKQTASDHTSVLQKSCLPAPQPRRDTLVLGESGQLL